MAPRESGKTTILQEVAFSVLTQYPDITLGVVMVGERREEVNYFREFIRKVLAATNSSAERAYVIASTVKRAGDEWVKTAEDSMEVFLRMAETKKDVVVLFDSMTRYVEALSETAESSGRTLTGGLDAGAVFPLRSLFSDGEALSTGGSVTLIATCLCDTPAKFEQVVADKMHATGNCTWKLDGTMATHEMWPAFDGIGSSTRRDHKILPTELYPQVMRLRRHIADMAMAFGGYIDPRSHTVNTKIPHLVMEPILEALAKTKSNEEFLATYLASLSEK